MEKTNETILTIAEKGYGKRSAIDEYRLTGRAVKGVINLAVSSKTGNVITTTSVNDKDSVCVCQNTPGGFLQTGNFSKYFQRLV